MRKIALTVAAMFLSAAVAVPLAAQTGYVSNPTTNSKDWAAAVAANGGTVVTNIDFDTPSVGATYTASTGFTGPVFSAGPAQGNNISGTVSPGEGPHAASNILRSPTGGTFSLLVNFTGAVSAVGLDTIDYFGVNGFNNNLTLSAFSGLNGSGTLLGSYNSVLNNFQNNNTYFMGLTSSTNNINSFVFSRSADSAGDAIGIDNIRSAMSVTAAVPEPASWAMMIFGIGAAGGSLRRRNSKVTTRVAYA